MSPAAVRCFSILVAVMASWLTPIPQSDAGSYPTAPIKFVVPYPAGGAGDIVARLVGEKLSVALATPVVVLNRPGASGTIGAMAVVSAAPDGYTVLVGHAGEIAINPHWAPSASYDPDKDLMPVGLAAVMPLALVVPGSAPYSTVAEMLTYAKD